MSDNASADTTILLICREGQGRRLYQEELEQPGIVLICVRTLMEFFRPGVYCPLNGIFVDMPSYMRFTDEEKRIMTELVTIMPALRLKCNESTGEIRSLPFEKAAPGNSSPTVFVQEHCKAAPKRKIRTSERTLLNMPTLLNRGVPVEDVVGARSVTANISCGGCFLIYFEQWCVGDRGWLILTELTDSTPVQVEICSIRPWGERRSLPGMGVKFIEVTESQNAELTRLGGQSLMQQV